MSLVRIVFLILTLNSFTYGQELKAYMKEGKEHIHKPSISGTQKFSGNLKKYLTRYMEVSPDHIFSDNMEMIEDSIFIDMEIQKDVAYSKHLSKIMLASLQRAYRFKIRDTLLNEVETVYVVSVADKSKLEKSKIDDYEFLTYANDSKNQYHLAIGYCKNLHEVKSPLELIKLMDEKMKLPVVTSFSEEFDGLYNFLIPTHGYTEEGDAKYFDSLLDVNPVLFNYGLQVQKVTRPIRGKVVEFFEVRSKFEVPFRPVLKF